MKKLFIFFTTSFFLVVGFWLFGATEVFSATGTIDPNNEGWSFAIIPNQTETKLNFKCQNCNVSVADNQLSGFAWSENFGWINLNPTNGGVLNDGDGNLSGFAWGENAGWVNFNPNFGGVTIQDGFFYGSAWSENVGWIIFDCGDLLNACVYTDWSPEAPEPPPGGGGGGSSQPPACSDGIDNDGDGYIDYPNDTGCASAEGETEVLTACGLPNATNFNPLTNVHDESLCLFEPVIGCMDPSAINHNSSATVGDDTCIYAGCTNPAATNYNSQATVNDGSCSLVPPPVDEPVDSLGCTDSYAENFNSSAIFDDGSCVYSPMPVVGCMNPNATNFNPLAEISNGSCIFAPIESGGEETGSGDGATNSFFDLDGISEETKEQIALATIIGALAVGVALLVGQGGTTARFLVSPLRLLNSIPTILGFRRKRRPWGTVYDSVTKQPLDPVYVELKDESGKSVATSITDIDGRYGFLPASGVYTITAGKKDYVFPSTKLVGKTKDVIYDNLYFGETFNWDKDDEVVAKNIPLDNISFNWNEFEKENNKKLMKFFSKTEIFISKIANTAFIVGFIFSTIAAFFKPSVFNIVILSIYVVVFLLSLFGIKPQKPGFVYDGKSGFPLSFGIIRVFSATLQREVSHTIIGKTGRYFSLVPNGSYYLEIERKVGEDKYEKVFRSEIFTVKKGHINKNISIII